MLELKNERRSSGRSLGRRRRLLRLLWLRGGLLAALTLAALAAFAFVFVAVINRDGDRKVDGRELERQLGRDGGQD